MKLKKSIPDRRRAGRLALHHKRPRLHPPSSDFGETGRRFMQGAFVALGLLALTAGCSNSNPTAGPTNGPFEIVQTHFLGSLWSGAYAKASIVSQDGGESFVVPGGAIWAFGDTFKGSRSATGKPHFAGGAFAPAIAFLAEKARSYPPAFDFLVSSNLGGVRAIDFLPEERPTDRYRIWPLGGIYMNGKCYLYYSLIEVFGTGSWDFRGLGSGLARATNALGTYERLRPHGNWRFPVEPTQVIETSDWLYLFSIQEFDGKQGVGLARVRPEKIEEPDAYEFFAGAGPRYSSRKTDAACLVNHVPGQVAVAWNGYLQKYVMASSSDFEHPREIRLLVAEAPAGPWSAPVARIIVPERAQGKRVEMVYCTYLHPELFRENGRVMNLTYSLGLKDSSFDANCEMVEIEVKRRN
jgi:hypothetical protein